MNESTSTLTCYSDHCGLRNKLFLTPKDLMDLMGVSESLIYKYLEDPPFRVERIGGKKIVIFANSFWKWYNGEVA